MTYVKSTKDGRWYVDQTEWKYVLDSLVDALGYFSEPDLNSELYIIINHLCDEVSKRLK